MARISIPTGNAPESHRLLLLQPTMGKAMAQLSQSVYEQSTLDKRIREAMRMKVAQLNNCQICLNYRFPELAGIGINEAFYAGIEHYRDSPIFDAKEKLAIEYAERFVNDHGSIDNVFFDELKEHFSSEVIYQMSVTVAALLANGRILQVLDIEQSCAL